MSTKARLLPSTPSVRAEALERANVTAEYVLNALLTELGISTDQELAQLIGVSKATVSAWRSRNSIPYELVVYLSITTDLDINFILTGRGRLSGYLLPSETLDDPRFKREVLATALADVAPIERSKKDLERAADKIMELARFYTEQMVRDHRDGEAGKLFAGRFVEFACEVLRARREGLLGREIKDKARTKR